MALQLVHCEPQVLVYAETTDSTRLRSSGFQLLGEYPLQSELTVEVVVRNADGGVESVFRRRSDSYVKQFSLGMRHMVIDDGSLTPGTDVTYSARALTQNSSCLRCNAANNDGTFGVVAGTGSTPVTVDDYALPGKIAHGSTSGTLTHQAVTFTTTTIADQTATFKLSRVFVNNSGGSITVNEVGVYAKYSYAGNIFCYLRDVITPTLVENTQMLTVTYTYSVTSPGYTSNWLKLQEIQIRQTNLTPTNVAGSSPAFGPFYRILEADAAAGDTMYGIVVGSGTSAENINDIALQTQITHGTGSGQLQYGTTSIPEATASGNDSYYEVSRMFTNNSGGTVTVNELALYANGNGSSNRYCVFRVVIAGGVLILDGQAVTFKLRHQVSI